MDNNRRRAGIMADIIGDGSWYIATDGEGVFHPVELTVGLFMGTGQPHVIKGRTEDEVFGKVFDNPKREPQGSARQGEYIIENQKSRTRADIISAESDIIKNDIGR
jgi:hypothetical protein